MSDVNPSVLKLAEKVAIQFSRFSVVESVALAGSQATGDSNSDSDIDLYVYATGLIPLPKRVSQIEKILQSAPLLDSKLVVAIDELIDNLDQLLEEEGFDPHTSSPVKT